MALMHMERAGHVPMALLGGGTAMVGDPSGKTEMRKMLSEEDIRKNAEKIALQLRRYLDFSSKKSLLVNNADWLRDLNYIEFLRDIGRHFSVNKMLTAEAYRLRMETGLSFLEFNYQILQAYDFLVLFQKHGCAVQMGGDDQWGNIVAGTDLIRRVTGGVAEGVTFPLLQTASGEKMGKTAKGALWLDPGRTSPYEFYQYWINVDDRDVARFLSLFTFLPMEEIARLCSGTGADLRQAKEVLAFEATQITHGEAEALHARSASKSLFSEGAGTGEGVPSTSVSIQKLSEGWNMVEAFVSVGLCSSRSEVRRLIRGGGAYVNGEKVSEEERILSASDIREGRILLRAGKNNYHRIDAI
jgi:tyrosyl-tRNA synthetase